MRIVIDGLVALMIIAILAGVVIFGRGMQSQDEAMETTRTEVHRFQQQIALQAALGNVEINERGFPSTIDPAWFNEDMPRNDLLPDQLSWVEVAGREHAELDHPPVRAVVDNKTPAFWYNPYKGVVRGRVPQGLADSEALRQYNYVNEAELTDLHRPADLLP